MEINKIKLHKDIKEKYLIDNNTFVLSSKENPKDFIETEVGDIKQPDFYPQVKMKRWDNEVNFSARIITDEEHEITSDNEKIKLLGSKKDIHFYPLEKCEKYEDGGYEFEVILKEKPDTNIINFSIQTKGLEFLYQPELTEAQKIAQRITNQPDDVKGSYAVYYKDCPLNIVGGKEYKAGKFCHIYRPQMVDAEGNKTWGKLNIDENKGILSVEIPQEFLDSAVYPVRHATGLEFGWTSQGAYEFGASSNYMYGTYTASATGSYRAVSMSGYFKKIEELYMKGVLLLQSDKTIITNGVGGDSEQIISSSYTLKTSTFGTKPTLGSATNYYLSYIISTGGSVNFKIDLNAESGKSFIDSTNSYSSPANPGTVETSNHRHPIYCTYEADVTAPTVTTQSATLVKMSGATGNGNITNNGGGTITEKGICYILGTSGTPTTADLTVHDHTDSTGAFTEIITGLLTGRAYRFRAYATNSAGTGYGDTVQVYTLTNFLQMFQ